jgi:hypothetical protein
MPRPAPLLLLLLPVLLLPVACAAPDPADPASVLQEALANHQASLAGIAPRAAAAGGEGTGPTTPIPTASRPALPGSPPTMAGQLVGQGPETVTGWLGEPRLRRTEGNAEIWHYQAPQCHLDLVLYREDGERQGLRVAFAAARAVGTTRRGEAACLGDIARGAELRPSRAPMVEEASAGA